MQDSRCGKPAFNQRRKLQPSHPAATLTASPQHAKPEFLERRSELLQTRRVAGDRVIVAPPPKHTQYPGADLRQVQVHFPFQRVLQFAQLVTPLLDRGDAADGEVPFPCLPANVREAQKVERLGRAIATLLSSFGRVASELDQPRFLRMQFQAELGEPFPERRQAVLRIGLLAEANHEIIRIAHDDDFACRVTFPPRFHLQIQDVVQEHVCEER